MRQLLTTLLFTFLTSYLFSQPDSSVINRWGDSLAKAYAYTDPAYNFMERQSSAVHNFILVDNKFAKTSIGTLEEKHNISTDSASLLFFNLAYDAFVRRHLWDDSPGILEKYKDFFQAFSNGMCPCLGDKISKDSNGMLSEEDITACAQNLSTNQEYVRTATDALSGLSPDKQQHISSRGGLYLFQHCPAAYKFISKTISGDILRQYSNQQDEELWGLSARLAESFAGKEPALTTQFPGYKQFASDLKTVQQIQKSYTPMISVETKNVEGGQHTRIENLYNFTGDSLIFHGQLIYVLSRRSPSAKVISYKFTPKEKLKNATLIMQKIKDEEVELPPPPGTEMKKLN